jgi:hypothetical protein
VTWRQFLQRPATGGSPWRVETPVILFGRYGGNYRIDINLEQRTVSLVPLAPGETVQKEKGDDEWADDL